MQIIELMSKGDTQAALKGITDYRVLNVPVPLPLLFTEARLSLVLAPMQRI